MYLLAMTRDAPRWYRTQAAREWDQRDILDMEERTVGVLGMGPIGLEVARLCAEFGIRVIGMRRTPRGDEPCETGHWGGCTNCSRSSTISSSRSP